MIKRQFYAIEHADNGDDASSSSSSSSSSSLNTSSDLSSAAEDEQDDGAWPEEEEEEEEGASFGWHASEAVDIEDHGLKSKKKPVSNQWAEAVEETEKERAEEKGLEETVVIHIGGGRGRRGVYKCRLCPKILCLSEETMQAHLGSKGHARSVKQLVEGKLKVQLDSDGEEEEDGETHAERNARMKATAQMKVEPVKRKRNVGRQQQRKRVKQKQKPDDLKHKETLRKKAQMKRL
ncbi:unnamed protein product [Sphagnum troendelagicum]|uniref:U1-type domain-containing protein n=1 Tax=Sphagnum troendelagicum TaxID=128251 RepID=A0ABP0V3S3_9BRYO